ncbi:hypothetical protein RCO48_20475 [Peribacillus frigoritolerans]|nr:hypothetical protein [Peribacillus frigoritolerans]
MTKLNNLRTVTLKVGQKIEGSGLLLPGSIAWRKKGLDKEIPASKKGRKTVSSWAGSILNRKKTIPSNSTPNLNVVSPRSYTLTDTGNYVSVSVDTKYIQAAHKQGKQVWQLIGNKFDPVLTGSVLGNTKKNARN